jgi:hypothetical protein
MVDWPGNSLQALASFGERAAGIQTSFVPSQLHDSLQFRIRRTQKTHKSFPISTCIRNPGLQLTILCKRKRFSTSLTVIPAGDLSNFHLRFLAPTSTIPDKAYQRSLTTIFGLKDPYCRRGLWPNSKQSCLRRGRKNRSLK